MQSKPKRSKLLTKYLLIRIWHAKEFVIDTSQQSLNMRRRGIPMGIKDAMNVKPI